MVQLRGFVNYQCYRIQQVRTSLLNRNANVFTALRCGKRLCCDARSASLRVLRRLHVCSNCELVHLSRGLPLRKQRKILRAAAKATPTGHRAQVVGKLSGSFPCPAGMPGRASSGFHQ